MFKKSFLLVSMAFLMACGQSKQNKTNKRDSVNTDADSISALQPEVKKNEPVITKKTVNAVYKSEGGTLKTSFSIPIVNDVYPALKETLSEKNLLGESLNDVVANFKSCGCGTTKFDFDVMYESPEVVSLALKTEGMGAYSSSSITYLTLNTSTGQPVSLNNEINVTGLNWMLNSYKQTLLKRAEERQQELSERAEADSTDWEIDDLVSTDIKSLTTESLSKNYAFTKDGIIIYSDPVLPHAALALEPDRMVKFYYRDLFPYQTATSTVLKKKLSE